MYTVSAIRRHCIRSSRVVHITVIPHQVLQKTTEISVLQKTIDELEAKLTEWELHHADCKVTMATGKKTPSLPDKEKPLAKVKKVQRKELFDRKFVTKLIKSACIVFFRNYFDGKELC